MIAPLLESSLPPTSWGGGGLPPPPQPLRYFLEFFTGIEMPSSFLNHHSFDPVNPPATFLIMFFLRSAMLLL